jgi:hypothetical protein
MVLSAHVCCFNIELHIKVSLLLAGTWRDATSPVLKMTEENSMALEPNNMSQQLICLNKTNAA